MIKIKGVDTVIKNLRLSKKKMGVGLAAGLLKAGLFLMRESQKRIPVQFGTLKASSFVRLFGFGIKTEVILGYTAFYAAYVHENMDALHGEIFNMMYASKIARMKGKKGGTVAGGWFKRGRNQQAKFLEAPARINRLAMLKIIRDTLV